jgi:hypothetical protein
MERFGVSQVAATLGLTLFVAGYGEFQFPLSPLYLSNIEQLVEHRTGNGHQYLDKSASS